MGQSTIEWTDTTWNPIAGCRKVSPGCDSCYAIRDAHRLAGNPNPKIRSVYEGLTNFTNSQLNWTGTVRPVPERLTQPLHWKKPRRVFVNSMSDLFHEDVPDSLIYRVFAIMALAQQHVFQILTKRPMRMQALLSHCYLPGRIWDNHIIYDNGTAPAIEDCTWPLPNVWLGVSVEDQQRADERVPILLQTPAIVRFLSCEPLIGAVTLDRFWMTEFERKGSSVIAGHPLARRLQWLIVGGESGPRARLMYPDWARSLRDQCLAANVPFFFKQWGGVNKKRAGRLLDGQTWNAMPTT